MRFPDPNLPYIDLASPNFSTRSRAVNDARDSHWCARTPYGLAVLRHRQVGLLLRDPRLRQGSYSWPDTNRLQGSFAAFWKRSIISQEGDLHRRLRQIAIAALSPDYIATLKPRFDTLAETLADQLVAQGTCEFMADFCTPFAGQAICTLLGLPLQHWHALASDASDLGLAMGVECKRHEAVYNAACDRLMALADVLIAEARAGGEPAAYVARLVTLFDREAGLEEQHLRDLVLISIFGGVDTTRSQLGLAIGQFIDHDDQWQALREDPGLVGQAVEECIRANPTTTWATREAIEDFVFEGEAIGRGETLHMLVHASARDPAVCENDRFDIRVRRKVHFGFGGGAHHCIGHLVARTDIASALLALSQRVTRFSYCGEPHWLPDSGNTGPVRLPLQCHAA